MSDSFRKNLKMRPLLLNYKHLYYFWVVSKEGSISRAAKRLDLAPQTVSVQLSQLEQSLGVVLYSIEGRNLALSEEGNRVLRYADEIFDLGTEMQEVMRTGKTGRALPLRVGIVGALPKLLSFRLLEPALRLTERVRELAPEGVTVALDKVIFHAPVHVGDIVNLHTQTIRVGTTSITVKVLVQVERFATREIVDVTEAQMTFVAVDEQGRPTPVAHVG